MKSKKYSSEPVRYAVVGLGDIAQGAVLPAFKKNARTNSRLVGLVSDDPGKLSALGRHYRVADRLSYRDYDSYLRSGRIDAVYLALPNSMHCDFAVRAANAGIHVLCEKPLATDEDQCHAIIEACTRNRVMLMTAYRLHFERANLEAIRIVKSGKLGKLRIFQSLFTMQVKPGNIRLHQELGGGTLYDIGVYCINAARYLFQAEPTEVFACSARNGDSRFREVDEMTSGILRFPDERLASFTTSFGAADSATYSVVGTKGLMRLSQAYEYSDAIEMEITIKGQTEKRKYVLRDQFAPELIYFSDCILKKRNPEPSGIEGLLDVHIVRSLYESARKGTPVALKPLKKEERPSLKQEIHRFPARRGPKIHAESPTY